MQISSTAAKIMGPMKKMRRFRSKLRCARVLKAHQQAALLGVERADAAVFRDADVAAREAQPQLRGQGRRHGPVGRVADADAPASVARGQEVRRQLLHRRLLAAALVQRLQVAAGAGPAHDADAEQSRGLGQHRADTVFFAKLSSDSRENARCVCFQ